MGDNLCYYRSSKNKCISYANKRWILWIKVANITL